MLRQLLVSASLGLLYATALAQAPAGSTEDYTVQRTQSVENAPSGFVGRKTTDREHRIGNPGAASGNEATYVLTLGGFARRCPTAEGIVEGNFEYTLTYDGVNMVDGETQRERIVRRLMAQLKGRVGDDARLREIELEGTFSAERSGTHVAAASSSRPVRTTFRPGATGEPNWDAMRAVAEMAADVAVANVVLMGGTLYKEAEVAWTMLNACVEFTFDPPTDTRGLGPSEAVQVRAELRAKNDNAPVPWKTDHIGVNDGAGTVSPRAAESPDGAPVTFTYTASSEPKRGHGINLATASRAGYGNGEWRIIDRPRYEGTFSQTDTFDQAIGIGTVSHDYKITGRLVWTPEEAEFPMLPTFGDTRSSFFRPSAGAITVEVDSEGRGITGGSCKIRGTKTFQVAQLPENALQHLWLEIAEDGRYKLSLGMFSRYLQTPVESVCRVMGRQVRDNQVWEDGAIELGIQQGTVSEEGVVGRLAAPIRRAYGTIDGSWSFRTGR